MPGLLAAIPLPEPSLTQLTGGTLSRDMGKVLDDPMVSELDILVRFVPGDIAVDEEFLRSCGFEPRRTFEFISTIHAKGPRGSLDTLVSNPRVSHVSNNDKVTSDQDTSTSVINATKAWFASVLNMGKEMARITGEGVTVCVLDTGMDASHPDLDYGDKTLMNLIDTGGVWVEMENTDLWVGHGTHVAGTVGGNGEASATSRRGIAPGCNIIGLTVANAQSPDETGYIAGLEWVYDHTRPGQNSYNIRCVTNSWHTSVGDYDPDAPLTMAIEALAFENNVVSTWSAGNDGRDNPNGEYVTTSQQGTTPVAICCAAYEHDGSAAAEFTSRGEPARNETFPDLGAPGVAIWSAAARRTMISSTSFTQNQNRNPYYLAISGTSMSTPHIAGLVALLWQACPSMMVSDRHDDYSGNDSGWWKDPRTRIHEVEWIMEATCTYLAPSEATGVPVETTVTGMDGRPQDYVQGYGIVNADRAVGVALTLQRLRERYPLEQVSVVDALKVYQDVLIYTDRTSNTDTLSGGWHGEFSRFNNQLGVYFQEVNQTRRLPVPEGAKSVTISLTYAPLDLDEKVKAGMDFSVDMDGDGNPEYAGNPGLGIGGSGQREMTFDAPAPGLWDIGIVGNVRNLPDPATTLMDRNYIEARMEYDMSVVIVMDMTQGDTAVNLSVPPSIQVALDFGDPSPEYSDGELTINTWAFDLDKALLEEDEESGPPEGGRGALIAGVVLLLLLAGVLYIYLRRKGRAAEA